MQSTAAESALGLQGFLNAGYEEGMQSLGKSPCVVGFVTTDCHLRLSISVRGSRTGVSGRKMESWNRKWNY